MNRFAHNSILKFVKYCSLPFSLFVLSLVTVFCDGTKTQNDLKNALSISENLRKSKKSALKTFSTVPGNHTEEDSYTVRKHTIKPGDTLHDLAIQYGADSQSIQQANGIKDNSELKPGQIIFIPLKKSNSQ